MTETNVADDAKAAAEAASEDGGAQATQDEVDRLLDQYRQEKKAAPAPEPKQQTEDNALEARLKKLEDDNRALRERDAKSRTQTGIQQAVNAVKGDLNMPDRVVRGLLQDEAANDTRFMQAFLDQDNDPEAWGKILKGKAAQWKREIGELPNADLTADREAIRAAASSATAPQRNEGPSGAKLAAMTPDEREDDFQKWISGA